MSMVEEGNKMKNIMLKREWLESVKTWTESANRWKKSREGDREYRNAQYKAFMKWADNAQEKADAAPVKIVVYYEDGRVETVE